MARSEADREDLMSEGVALVRRIELRVPGQVEAVTAGWRSNGWFSIYFGQDPAFTFDGGRLRRAYADGHLFRTQGTSLARLTRERTATESTLRRHDLTDRECTEFLASMRQRLDAVEHSLRLQSSEVLRVAGEAVAGDLLAALGDALHAIQQEQNPLAPAIARRR